MIYFPILAVRQNPPLSPSGRGSYRMTVRNRRVSEISVLLELGRIIMSENHKIILLMK